MASTKTKDKLRTLHPSRHHQIGLAIPDIIALLDRHFSDKRPHVQSVDVVHLLTAIGVAAAEMARSGDGHVSRKDSIAALRAMLKQSGDEVIASLRNCDAATFARIQDAHAELYFDSNGIPVIEIPAATADTDEVANHLCSCGSIELPTAGRSLHLPLGYEGLELAIRRALDRATGEAQILGDDVLSRVLDVAETNRNPAVGRQKKPYQIELAKACTCFWEKYGLAERQEFDEFSGRYASPKTQFAKDIFLLAGIRFENDESTQIANLLSESKKSN